MSSKGTIFLRVIRGETVRRAEQVYGSLFSPGLTCPLARSIVACQRIGWHVPRTPPPATPEPPSRASLQQQLRQAEARGQ